MVARLRTEWTGLPRWARWVLAAYLTGFADGTAAHVRALAQGRIHAYSAFSQVPLQVFFVCLVVLDPLVAVLAGFVRRAGIWLAAGVMALDMTANWAGNWHWLHADPGRLPRAGGGLLLITFFGLFVLLTARPMLRVMKN